MAASEATTAKADAIRAEHADVQARLAGRADLSPGAKATLAAKAYVRARDAMHELEVSSRGADDMRRRALTGRLFGTEGVRGDPVINATSLRDAQDRAAKLDSARDALSALDRADSSGDELMARAIAQQAHVSGWRDVLQQYGATRPTAIADVNELSSIAAPSMDARQMFAFVMPAPAGVNSANAAQVAADPRFQDVR